MMYKKYWAVEHAKFLTDVLLLESKFVNGLTAETVSAEPR